MAHLKVFVIEKVDIRIDIGSTIKQFTFHTKFQATNIPFNNWDTYTNL